MQTNRTVFYYAKEIVWVMIFLFSCIMLNAQKYYEINQKEDSQVIGENIDSNKIYRVVDEMPRFPGCEDLGSMGAKKQCAQKKLLEFVYENLEYPLEAREEGIEGMVVVRFYIDTLGKLQNIELIRDIGGGTGKVALDVFRKMNAEGIRWVPGKNNGKVVNVTFNMPIRFQLPSKEKN